MVENSIASNYRTHVESGSTWLDIYWTNGAFESPCSDFAVPAGFCFVFFFHMQSVDHHTLALSYLGKVRSWQGNKSHNGAIKKEKKKEKERNHKSLWKKRQNHHAATRAKINSCHVKSHKQDTKSCHAQFLHVRALGLLGLYAAAKKRKTADKAADLLGFALLPGISCFDSA